MDHTLIRVTNQNLAGQWSLFCVNCKPTDPGRSIMPCLVILPGVEGECLGSGGDDIDKFWAGEKWEQQYLKWVVGK